jgi:hypothetical protein
MKQKNKRNTAGMIALGASLASLAATAYFFMGPNGKQNRKDAKAWALKMKADVIAGLEETGTVTEAAYGAVVDSVAEEYMKGMKASRAEIKALAKDMKKHWKTIRHVVNVAREKSREKAK